MHTLGRGDDEGGGGGGDRERMRYTAVHSQLRQRMHLLFLCGIVTFPEGLRAVGRFFRKPKKPLVLEQKRGSEKSSKVEETQPLPSTAGVTTAGT